MTTARNLKPTLGDLLKLNSSVHLSAYKAPDGQWLYTASLETSKGEDFAGSAFTVEEAIATLIRRQAQR